MIARPDPRFRGRLLGRLATPVAAVIGVGVGVYNTSTLVTGLFYAY